MGDVYRATDTRLDRMVALKVLPDGVTASPAALERFQREARAASALNHPSLVHIYAIGETGSGLRYIAMEHVDGRTLRQVLRDGPLSLRRALEALDELGIRSELGTEHLERDAPPEAEFARPVDLPHPARADELDDLVVRDEAANHALETEGITGILGSPLPASQ